MSLILAGMVFGQFSFYALVLYCWARRGLVRAFCAVMIVHLCFVGIAASLCSTYGWPDNSNEGQHAREAGELYPGK